MATSGPGFLVIGAGRSGTTLLCHQLARHPQVFVTDPKEPHFLAFEGRPPSFTGPGDDITINRRAVTDEGRWRELFAGDDSAPLRGEGSVSTLYYAERSVESIDRHCPDARLIVLLRDPVERAWSAHQYLTGRGFESASFEQALDDEEARRAAGWHHLWHYVAMGRYTEQLEPFLDRFGEEHLLLLDYEQLANDPQAAMDRCFAFLGVDGLPIGDRLSPINASGVPRNRVVTSGLRRIAAHDTTRALVRRTVPFTVRERVRTLTTSPAESMPASCRGRLDEIFVDERRTIRARFGAMAPAWAAA